MSSLYKKHVYHVIFFGGGKKQKKKIFLSVPRVNSPGTKDSENEYPGRANSEPSI